MVVYKGWNAEILKDGVVVGLCDSASVDIATGLEPYYQVGSRTPATLVEGNQEVTGSISKAMINTDWLSFVEPTGILTDFELRFRVPVGGSSITVYCYNCKFETGSIDIPQDGVLKENYDFRAVTVVILP